MLKIEVLHYKTEKDKMFIKKVEVKSNWFTLFGQT